MCMHIIYYACIQLIVDLSLQPGIMKVTAPQEIYDNTQSRDSPVKFLR